MRKYSDTISKREKLCEKIIGKSRKGWTQKEGPLLGSGLLNARVSSEGFKSWVKVDPKSPLKKYVILEYPLDIPGNRRGKIIDRRRKWLDDTFKTYERLASTGRLITREVTTTRVKKGKFIQEKVRIEDAETHGDMRAKPGRKKNPNEIKQKVIDAYNKFNKEGLSKPEKYRLLSKESEKLTFGNTKPYSPRVIKSFIQPK